MPSLARLASIIGLILASLALSMAKLRTSPPRSTRLSAAILVAVAALLFRAFLPAEKGFVALEDAASAAHRGKAASPHGFTDTVADKPSGS